MWTLWLKRVIYATIFAIVISFSLFCIYYTESDVSGTSMVPTLNSSEVDDYVYISKTKYTYGDIVVVDTHDSAVGKIIKRVIGMANDRIGLIKIDNEYMLTLNNRVLYEDYLCKKTGAYSGGTKNEYGMAHYARCFESLYEQGLAEINADGEYYVIVPEDSVFILGDNRAVSVASETHGAYACKDIVGKVEYIRSGKTPKWWYVLTVVLSNGSKYGKYNGYNLCDINANR